MRKLLLLFSLFVSPKCFSQGALQIVSVNHNPTWAGDSLVIQFEAYGNNFWGVDTGTVFIKIAGNIVSTKAVVDIYTGNQQWTILFPNIPDTAILIRFIAGSGQDYDAFFIHVDNILDIPIPTQHKNIISKRYFSILGVEQFYPTDILIEESKFNDGSVSRRKVYIE